MHYQLFLPTGNVEQSLNESLAAVGLADHAGNATPIKCEKGPGGLSGKLVGWISTAAGSTCLDYRPDKQTWIESVPVDGRERGAYWVGIWNDSPPTESELRRPYTQSGEWVEFAASKWKLPTVGSVDRYAAYNDDGSMRWVPVREFAWLMDESEKLKEEYLQSWGAKELAFQFNPTEFVDWLLRLLRVNYHMTPEVAAHLELWRSGQVADAVLLSLGLSRVSEEPSDG